MAHIGCVCGNDVRGNSIETIYRFVSDDLMNEYAESETFFGLPYLPGDKAEIWLCNECGRAIFSDDDGLCVTRYMRPAEPAEFSQCDDDAKRAYCTTIRSSSTPTESQMPPRGYGF
ncbi:hypothetical protein [Enorma massiliensis]|uniref:hypothetical protein n=1 Tax=Enorma massiliensis TaxID=1472761 RepID=UPI00030C4BC3|nr:hypothetical protein [Enorma massiliensis]